MRIKNTTLACSTSDAACLNSLMILILVNQSERLADYIIVTIQNYSHAYTETAAAVAAAAKSLIRLKLEADGMRAAVVFRNDLSMPTATLPCG